MKAKLDRKVQNFWNNYLALWKKLMGWKLFLFYTLHYTFLFIVLNHFVFIAFEKAGKDFIWDYDGISQHFTRLVYINQLIRNGIRSLVSGEGWKIPMYDFRTGLVAQDLQIGFPQILAIFYPKDKIDVFYNMYVLTNYYLIGLSFSIFGFFFRQKPLPIMIGAVTYTFCGFSIFAGVRHPHFLVPMMFLPLLIIGAEKVLHKEKAYLLLVTVFLSLTTQGGLYFSCMQAIFVAIYIFVRFPDIYKENRLHEFGCLLGRCMIWGGTGILLASFVAIPSLFLVLGIGRIGRDVTSDISMWHYTASYYKNFLLEFTLISKDVGSWSIRGFSTLTIPTICLLFIRREKKERSLRILFVILTIMLFIPVVAYIMSGFSNISNRFCFGYAFCVSAILMFMLPYFSELSRSTIAAVGIIMVVYFAFCYFLTEHKEEQILPFVMLLVAVLILLCCYMAEEKGKKWLMPACLLITCFSVYYSAYLKYDPSQENYVNQFHKDVYKLIEDGQYSSLSQSKRISEDGSLYRVSGNNILHNEVGMSFYYGLNGLSMYPYFGWSSDFLEWMEEMEVARKSTVRSVIYGLDSHSPLLTLAGVKYYAERESNVSITPYGYTEVDRIQKGKSTDRILENQYWLPIGYTYKTYINHKAYHEMDALGKQEAQLQAVVLEEEPMLSSLTEANVITTAQQIPCEVIETNGLTWNDGKLTVKEDKATMLLAFTGIPETETYLRIVNLDLTSGASTRRWALTATTGETSVSAAFSADAFLYSHGQKTQLLNMGYTENGDTTITITFPSKGTFRLNDIEIWCQPMDHYEEQMLALREEVLENVETNWRGLTGTISVSNDKFLCLSIPYLKGWNAYIDGKKVKLYRANTAFMGVELPAGNHVVELRYWLPGLTIGMIASGVGGFCLIALVFCQRKRKNGTVKIDKIKHL